MERGKILCCLLHCIKPLQCRWKLCHTTSCSVIYNISSTRPFDNTGQPLLQREWTAEFVLRIGRREASTQNVKNATLDCPLLGASRSTTQRRDLVRWHEGGSLYIHQKDNKKKVCAFHFTMFQNKYFGLWEGSTAACIGASTSGA
jgi:hypothetical protein